MKYIMLGRTVPEPTNERLDQYVCSAGISVTDDWNYSTARLYPLGLRGPKRWEVSEVPAERMKKDSRVESWKPTGAFGIIGKVPDSQKLAVVNECNAWVNGIKEANDRRISLAFIKPARIRFWLDTKRGTDEPSYQLYEGNHALKSNERFPYTPRLNWIDPDGRTNNVQLRDWGIWELMRKNALKLGEMSSLKEHEEYIGNSIRLSERTVLFIGNYANHKNVWCVISVLNIGEAS